LASCFALSSHVLCPHPNPILYFIGLDRLSLCCLAWENWLGKQETARQDAVAAEEHKSIALQQANKFKRLWVKNE
jgi:hypothetical protein